MRPAQLLCDGTPTSAPQAPGARLRSPGWRAIGRARERLAPPSYTTSREVTLTKAAGLLEESGHESLTSLAIPDSHWIKRGTDNPLERIMREIRRRTRAVGAFPDGKSGLNLAAARLRHIAGTRWATRKDMNMTPLFAEQTQGAVVA